MPKDATSKREKHGKLAVVRNESMVHYDPPTSGAVGLRADIKTMVADARAAYRQDVLKVIEETATHAGELERAIGDVSQSDAVRALQTFFRDELDRVLAKYS